MKGISLFSGCGGMDFAARACGIETLFSNDIMKEACATLKKYFPESEIHQESVFELKKFPKADIVFGGYPCQSFSMAGRRDPHNDERSQLYKGFANCLNAVNPKYFVAENVDGLGKLIGGHFLKEQISVFSKCGKEGYRITAQRVNAESYGVPQSRKRYFIVGVRNDLGLSFQFPQPTHGPSKKTRLLPFASHGDAIGHLPKWPKGEFYERPHDPEGHWSWYYMSRNRKADWDEPSYTIVANFRHITLHPAGPIMKLTWSNLKDGFKQRWDFAEGQYEHLAKNKKRMVLETPRRLSWRECALIQTFPDDFEPVGDLASKFTQIGNAVPPMLAAAVFSAITSGRGLVKESAKVHKEQLELSLL